ncbi:MULTISPECIES: hypothetical protein [unclassified Paenibacillus]|uniref:hypothetical protein n=1 Tax=unclassified Paenibacillus TaxID=185978 RepID=UPI0030F7B814
MINTVRVGTVSTVDEEALSVRVLFEDQDDMVSDELPIVLPFTEAVVVPPKVEDVVLCVFTSAGDGYCLGKIPTEEGE